MQVRGDADEFLNSIHGTSSEYWWPTVAWDGCVEVEFKT